MFTIRNKYDIALNSEVKALAILEATISMVPGATYYLDGLSYWPETKHGYDFWEAVNCAKSAREIDTINRVLAASGQTATCTNPEMNIVTHYMIPLTGELHDRAVKAFFAAVNDEFRKDYSDANGGWGGESDAIGAIFQWYHTEEGEEFWSEVNALDSVEAVENWNAMLVALENTPEDYRAPEQILMTNTGVELFGLIYNLALENMDLPLAPYDNFCLYFDEAFDGDDTPQGAQFWEMVFRLTSENEVRELNTNLVTIASALK